MARLTYSARIRGTPKFARTPVSGSIGSRRRTLVHQARFTRSGRSGLRRVRSLELALTTVLLAGVCAMVVTVPGQEVKSPTRGGFKASPTASSSGVGRICPTVQASGLILGSAQDHYNLYVPSGATVTLTGSVDVLAHNTLGQYQYDIIFDVDPIGFWYISGSGPSYNNGIGPKY